jgi:hypothetical protein
MRILLFLFLTTSVLAQNLSPEEQKNLIEENKMLKAQIQKKNDPTPQESQKIMETLIKGQKYQQDQAKALEELDKED